MNDHAFKVLIVDDEYWIRENLKSLIDWDAHSFVFLEPAEDGEMALRAIQEHAPDIVITDISMPFISGTELIEKTRADFPETVFIALSGYSDYEFVRTALVAGAMDYLLKPISTSDLLAVLSKAVNQLLAQQAEKRENQSIQEQLKSVSEAAMDREMSILIHRSRDAKLQAQSKALLEEYELVFSGFTMVLFHTASLTKIAKTPETGDIDKLVLTIKEQIAHRAAASKNIVFNYTYKTNEFFLLTDMDTARLYTLCKELTPLIERETGHGVTTVIGKHYFSFANVQDAYNEIRMALYGSEYRLASKLLRVADVQDKPAAKRITAEQEKQLLLAVGTNNRSLFSQVVHHGIDLKGCIAQKWSYIEVRQTVDSLAWILRNSAAKTGGAGLLALDNLIEALLQAVDNYNIEEIYSVLDQMMDEIFDSNLSGQSGSIRKTILQVQSYIDENYFEDLSLTLLSCRFHVDSSYLSKAFKQVVGHNLMLYISQKRIEKAIAYMHQQNVSLTEISGLVGYGDYAYFNRVFRKVMGVGPREYKESGGAL